MSLGAIIGDGGGTFALALPGLIAGLVLLMAGGQLVVREAATLAARLGISPLVIGVVIVGFGTSAPELATAVRASLASTPGLAFGNAVGASMANLLIVLPLAAFLAPLHIVPASVRAEIIAVAGAAALFIIVGSLPALARGGGLVMLGVLATWLAFSLRSQFTGQLTDRATSGPAMSQTDALQAREAAALINPAEPWWRAAALLVLGVGLLVGGADLLVSAAITLARGIGIGEDVLGLTLLSVGTCLPELATAIAAVRKRQPDIVIGNVLGSCLFNILAVGGAVHAMADNAVLSAGQIFDRLALLAASLIVGFMLLKRTPLGKGSAALLLAIYALWLAVRLLALSGE